MTEQYTGMIGVRLEGRAKAAMPWPFAPFFGLVMVLALLLGGCASVTSMVRATADVAPVPRGLTWEAVSAPGADWAAVSQVAEILSPALARFGWTQVSSRHAGPIAGQGSGQGSGQGAGKPEALPDTLPDVLVYISWDTRGPEVFYSEEPELSFGVGFSSSSSDAFFGHNSGGGHRYGRYGHDGRYGRYGRDPWGRPLRPRWQSPQPYFYDEEPSYQLTALYAHSLRIRAVRLVPVSQSGSVSTASGAAAARLAKRTAKNLAKTPVKTPVKTPAEDSAVAPYAPALAGPGSVPAPLVALLPSMAGMEESPLWEVNVSHVSSYASVRSLLPYLAAAAAGAAGRTAVEQVTVNDELEVTQE